MQLLTYSVQSCAQGATVWACLEQTVQANGHGRGQVLIHPVGVQPGRRRVQKSSKEDVEGDLHSIHCSGRRHMHIS